MSKTTYSINVAYRGGHDFVLNLDTNAKGDGVSVMTAKAVARALVREFGDDYEVSLTATKTTVEATQC